MTFILLNPSNTDDGVPDKRRPTLRKCIEFAKSWGCDELWMRNLFPHIARRPRELLLADSPAGGERGNQELRIAAQSSLIVAAWGGFVPFNRQDEAMELLAGKEILVFGLTKKGRPRHPLWVPMGTPLSGWDYRVS